MNGGGHGAVQLTGQLWYVSYGSNMSRGRLLHYLLGGRPAGASISYPGARDRSIPSDDAPVDLPGRVYFAGLSATWGGGMAFYDHDAVGPSPARAYRITAGQFADIAAQEMRRIPDAGDPLERIVVNGIEGGRHQAGPGRYETLIEVGRRDGLPMVTFTAPHGIGGVPHTQPAAVYLATIAEGLRQSRGWDEHRIAAHFRSLID